jgi:Ion transport protein
MTTQESIRPVESIHNGDRMFEVSSDCVRKKRQCLVGPPEDIELDVCSTKPQLEDKREDVSGFLSEISCTQQSIPLPAVLTDLHEDKGNQIIKESDNVTEVRSELQTDTLKETERKQELEFFILKNVHKRWSLHELRASIGVLLNSTRFQFLIVIMIVLNSILMGIATYDFVQGNTSVANTFEAFDKFFLIIFTIELVMQFLYRGLKLFLDGWLVFDFLIILLSWSLESLQVVRTFRVFRALRLVTRVKLLKNLVSALFSVGPRISVIFCLLVLIFYIYAVMCTFLFKDLFQEGLTDLDYFSRLDRSVWTLLVMMTLEWGDVSRQVIDVYPWSWPIFVSFIMITSFIAYNLIVAVVCDSVSIIEKQSKDDENNENQSKVESEDDQNCKIRELQNLVFEMTRKQLLLIEALSGALHDEDHLSGLSEILETTQAIEKSTT